MSSDHWNQSLIGGTKRWQIRTDSSHPEHLWLKVRRFGRREQHCRNLKPITKICIGCLSAPTCQVQLRNLLFDFLFACKRAKIGFYFPSCTYCVNSHLDCSILCEPLAFAIDYPVRRSQSHHRLPKYLERRIGRTNRMRSNTKRIRTQAIPRRLSIRPLAAHDIFGLWRGKNGVQLMR